MKYRNISVIVLIPLLLAGLLVSCSGGGGDDAPPLLPPAFTDLAGTRWNQVDTVSSSNNSCGSTQGDQDSFILHVASQSGNTITVYDERAGASNPVSGTMSGSVVVVNGSRYAVQGCSEMTASYSLTVNAAGTAYSGTGTIICLDDGCSVPITVSGTKI